MRAESFAGRKCSAVLAAGMGAAVCLTGSEVLAVSGTNGPDILPGSTVAEFGGKIFFSNKFGGGVLIVRGGHGTAVAGNGGSKLKTYAAGAACSVASSWIGYNASVAASLGGSGKYIKVKFTESATTKYGWLEFTRLGASFVIGAWSYNNAGEAIKTLAESITTTKLALADGRVKLHWANANEDGVARYEVQAKGSDGVWSTVDSSAPGNAAYSTNVPQGCTCRLVVEQVDGTTHEVNF